MSENLYQSDFYAWANQQAALLRAGQFVAADIAHIAEEIESLGKAEKRELVHQLAGLLVHLLKWQYQPTGRCTSWRLTIKEQRREVIDVLADNPSLKSRWAELLASAYDRAVLAVARETSLPEQIFPETCPWDENAILRADIWEE